jgi:hypothetical protein
MVAPVPAQISQLPIRPPSECLPLSSPATHYPRPGVHSPFISPFIAPLFSCSLAPISEGYKSLFAPPRSQNSLFSYSYKSIFPQPLSFHIHAKPPVCFQEFLPLRALCLGGKSIFFILLPPLSSLFALFSALVSFVFNRLQPLFRKHPGVGVCVRNPG